MRHNDIDIYCIYIYICFFHRPFGTCVAAVLMNSEEAISQRNPDRIRRCSWQPSLLCKQSGNRDPGPPVLR